MSNRNSKDTTTTSPGLVPGNSQLQADAEELETNLEKDLHDMKDDEDAETESDEAGSDHVA